VKRLWNWIEILVRLFVRKKVNFGEETVG